MWVTLGCLVRRSPLPIMVTYSYSRVRPCTCQGESRISVLMTLSGPDTQRPLLREWIQGDWGVRMWHRRCQSWVGGAVHESKSVYVCVWVRGRQEGGFGADCPRRSPLRVGLNEVISRPQSICYRGSSSDQGVAMARWTQKGVAWERVQGSGVRVRGSKVTASWTAHKRRRGWEKKEGRFGFLSPFSPFLLQVSARGGRRPTSGHHWTLTLNWGGEMK